MKKNLFRIITGTAICLLPFLPVCAQRITVGQKLPVSCLVTSWNGSPYKICFPTGQKKLIILEFWSHTCTSCIRNFPLLDSLQQEFGDNIQIVLVNRETQDSTARFFARRKYISVPKLAFLNNDKILHRYFVKGGYPFSVWVDSKGRVRNVATGSSVTKKNIAAVLHNIEPTLKLYGIQQPNNAFGSEVLQQMKYYSFISACSDKFNVGNAAGSRFSPGMMRVSARCSTVKDLFIRAFEEKGRFRFHVSSSFEYDTSVARLVTDKFTYDLLLPSSNAIKLYKVMQQDLERYFNISATVEFRPVKALALTRIKDTNDVMTKGGQPMNTLALSNFYHPVTDSLRELVNYPISALTEKLRMILEGILTIPFSDDTGYTGNIDFKVEGKVFDSYDIEGIRKALKEYGLDLVETEKQINVLVLKSIKNY
jgi:thiol-disulfide isomerase/thioredoxin